MYNFKGFERWFIMNTRSSKRKAKKRKFCECPQHARASYALYPLIVTTQWEIYHYSKLKAQNLNNSPEVTYYSIHYMEPMFNPRNVSEALKIVPY